MRKTTAFAFLVTLLAVTAAAQPQRTFVSAANGNDANGCSIASPCRNLRRGVDAVAAGGEVVTLDSGGYGTFSITKAVTVSAPPGVHAAVTVAPPDLYAITINTSGAVVLRGLAVSCLGGTRGISFDGGGQLRLDSCSVTGAAYGVVLNTGRTAMTDSVIAGNTYGVNLQGTSAANRALLTVDRTRFTGAGNVGLIAWEHSSAVVRNCVFSGNATGVKALSVIAGSATRVTIDNSIVTGNAYGALAQSLGSDPNTAVIRFSNSVIAHNTAVAFYISNAQIQSEMNNTVVGNASSEIFSGTFAAK